MTTEDDRLKEIAMGAWWLIKKEEDKWITFWTPAERVGLKAMGKALRGMMNLCPKNDSNRMIIWGEAVAIRAYVKAARKFKED